MFYRKHRAEQAIPSKTKDMFRKSNFLYETDNNQKTLYIVSNQIEYECTFIKLFYSYYRSIFYVPICSNNFLTFKSQSHLHLNAALLTQGNIMQKA